MLVRAVEAPARRAGPASRRPAVSLRVGSLLGARLILIGGMALFALATAYVNWVRYLSLRSTWPLDLAFFNNAAANTP